ncbi:MAG: L-fuculose-phosphate aldolase [Synergistales bacterium]|nr:L-fuculose-phosphate aldolase [Synergistales bacterium]
MLMQKEREGLAVFGRKMVERRLTTGTGGNLSVRSGERMALTPSGMEYDAVAPEDIVVMDLEGCVVEGARKPSSEYPLHRTVYRGCPWAGAVVHTHSVYCTVIASMRWEIPPVHYLVGLAGERVPCARYATFGTEELAEHALEALGAGKAVLLANHGLLAAGTDLEEAFTIAEQIEYVAEVYYRTSCLGSPVLLGREEIAAARERFGGYGQ